MTLPKAMLFVPCERVIIDSLTGRLSASFIHESIQPLTFTPDEEMLSQAPSEQIELFKQIKFMLPPLQTVTVWNKGEVKDTQWSKGEVKNDDVFEQIVTITAPDGRISVLANPVRFSFGESLGHRVLQITAPISGRLFGFSVLSAKIRRVGETDWHTAITYPLYVEEIPQEPETPIQPSPEA